MGNFSINSTLQKDQVCKGDSDILETVWILSHTAANVGNSHIIDVFNMNWTEELTAPLTLFLPLQESLPQN